MYRYNIYIYTYIIVYILYRTEYTGKMGQAGISTQSFSVLYTEGIVGINEIHFNVMGYGWKMEPAIVEIIW